MRRHAPAFALALLLASLGGCTGHRERVVVGSKNFTEQVLLGEILAQALEREGIAVERRLNLGGTFVCDRAIRSGEIDLYVEYTGTAWTAILKEKTLRDPAKVLEGVRDRYAASGLVWTEPLGFDDTFAVVVRAEDARRLGIRTLSEAVRHSPSWRIGVGYEFLERADGYDGLVQTYGFRFRSPARVMDLGLLYRALLAREVDVVVGNSTDGAIERFGLVVLEDDRHYFPPYETAPVVRRQALEKVSALRTALARLGGTISTEAMRRLNLEVESGRVSAEEAARRFLDGLTAGPLRP